MYYFRGNPFGLIFFSKPLIALMGQPENVVELAKPYLDMLLFINSVNCFQGYNSLLME
jgi:MATE family multidrug resistance protein